MKMKLFHTGYSEIREPDLHFGRKNADFGQGFYMSFSDEFAGKWAKERNDKETIVNSYELDTEGLNIKRFERDEEWYEYIYRNRRGFEDKLADTDVIIGPIAADTIYDTMGILTSGLVGKEESLHLLQYGKSYEQIVIKTDRAKRALRFLSSRVLDKAEIEKFREIVLNEEADYQAFLAEEMDKMQ